MKRWLGPCAWQTYHTKPRTQQEKGLVPTQPRQLLSVCLFCFVLLNLIFFFFFKIKKKQRTIQMLTRRGKVGAVSPTLCLVAGSRSVSLHLNVLYWFPASVTWRFNLISLPWHASLICVSVKPWWIIQTCFLYSLLCSSVNTSLVQVSILTLPDWFPYYLRFLSFLRPLGT